MGQLGFEAVLGTRVSLFELCRTWTSCTSSQKQRLAPCLLPLSRRLLRFVRPAMPQECMQSRSPACLLFSLLLVALRLCLTCKPCGRNTKNHEITQVSWPERDHQLTDVFSSCLKTHALQTRLRKAVATWFLDEGWVTTPSECSQFVATCFQNLKSQCYRENGSPMQLRHANIEKAEQNFPKLPTCIQVMIVIRVVISHHNPLWAVDPVSS